MKTFNINCFELTQPDGVGQSDVHIAYVAIEKVAKEWESKQTTWPRNYRKFKKFFMVFESIDEMESHSKESLRKQALSKLTDIDKEVLGLGE
jgi:hypothetical protein